MSPEYIKYRNVRSLYEDELKAIVLGILASDPATGGYTARDCEHVIDELTRVGVGVEGVNRERGGYRQVLATLAGAFLRLAGANMTAIDRELDSRDEGGLERLLESIRRRLLAQGGAQPQPQSPAATAPHRDPRRPEESPREYLEGLVDHDVAHVARSDARGRVQQTNTGDHAAASSPPAKRTLAAVSNWARIEIVGGVELHIQTQRLNEFSAPDARDRLIEDITGQLRRLLGGA